MLQSISRLALGILMLMGPPSFAKVVYLLDFDGTTVSDGESSSSWKTPWILVKINNVRTSAQLPYLQNSSPEIIEVSYHEYLELAALLGKDEGQLGSLIPVELDTDEYLKRPKTIVPGLYRVSSELSFKYYKTGEAGENYLIQNLNQAVARTQTRKYTKQSWQGLAFPLVQKALSKKETAGNVFHVTARNQSQAEMDQFYLKLAEMGFVQHASGVDFRGREVSPRIISLESAESIVFGRSLSAKKAQLPMEMAKQLLLTPDAKHDELSIKGKDAKAGVLSELHTLIVAEDHPQYVQAIAKQLKDASADNMYRTNIKFVLFNTGSEEDVRRSEWPYRWIVFEEGFARQALSEEIAAWGGNASLCGKYLGVNHAQ